MCKARCAPSVDRGCSGGGSIVLSSSKGFENLATLELSSRCIPEADLYAHSLSCAEFVFIRFVWVDRPIDSTASSCLLGRDRRRRHHGLLRKALKGLPDVPHATDQGWFKGWVWRSQAGVADDGNSAMRRSRPATSGMLSCFPLSLPLSASSQDSLHTEGQPVRPGCADEMQC